MMDVYYTYCSNGLMILISRIIVTPLKLIQCCVSRTVVSDSETPWTVDRNLLCPWDSPGKNSWSGLPFPSPRDLPNPGIEPRSPALQADDLPTEATKKLAILSKINFFRTRETNKTCNKQEIT